jgi:hypothetical protein
MKVHLRSFAALKKEAKNLRKTLITQCPEIKKPSLQSCRDVIAHFYGWASWNTMFVTHQTLAPSAYNTVQFIYDLNEVQSAGLQRQKQAALTAFLSTRGVKQENADEVESLLLTLPSQARHKKRYPDVIDNALDMASWTLPMWQGDTVIMGGDNKSRSDFYCRGVSPQLVRDGGLVIIDEDTAIPLILSLAKKRGLRDRLRVLRLDGASAPYVTHQLDLPQTESIVDLEYYFSQTLHLIDDSDGSGIWAGRAMSLLNAICKSLISIYGAEPGALYKGGLHFDFSFDALVGLFNDPRLPNKHKSGFSTYFNALNSAYSDDGLALPAEQQKSHVIEHHQYFSMMFAELPHYMTTGSKEAPLPLCGITELSQDDAITVLIMPTAKPYPTMLDRHAAGLMAILQHRVEMNRRDVLQSKVPYDNTKARLLLLDGAIPYIPKGLSAMLGRCVGWSLVLATSLSNDENPSVNQIEIHTIVSMATNIIILTPNDLAPELAKQSVLEDDFDPKEFVNMVSQGNFVYAGTWMSDPESWARLHV